MMDDDELLEKYCRELISMGFSTGHGDSLAELAGECVANLRECHDRLRWRKWPDEPPGEVGQPIHDKEKP